MLDQSNCVTISKTEVSQKKNTYTENTKRSIKKYTEKNKDKIRLYNFERRQLLLKDPVFLAKYTAQNKINYSRRLERMAEDPAYKEKVKSYNREWSRYNRPN